MDWSNDGEDCRSAVRQRGIPRTLWTGSQGQHSAAASARPGCAAAFGLMDILDALEHPVQVTEIAVDREGLRGYVIIGKTCRCAVNPDTNKLIMVAPHR